MKTIIRNATIVNEGRQFVGSVVIEGEYIQQVIEGDDSTQAYDLEIDATGLYLFPGVIDDHVHFREPGMTYKADIGSESRAAAAGGVTSYMEMPNTNPPTTTLDLLEEKFQIAAQDSRVNYSFYFGATNDNVDTLPILDRTRVPGVKVFMGSSTGNMLVDRQESLYRIFATSPLLLMAHCESTNVIEANIRAFKKRYKGQNDFPVRYHSRIRSVEACYESSSLAVQMAKETGARLHIAHISTAKELELFEKKPIEEKKITAEAVIAHLMFSTEDYDTLGTRIKCNPAVKTPEDRAALREALTNGLIDVVATDHAPHLENEKLGGALKAASGMPMIQFSLVSMLELSEMEVLPIERIPDLMSHNPAKLFRIEKRGFIRPGYYADLTLVDPEANWQVREGRYYTKCGWTPMDERFFKWRVRRTIINGITVFSDGVVVDGVRGKELRFS
ncbi:MAG: dihydroorotase [Bacteroidales bacterium]|jgi:dihydroorotase|nr:dihydroorotase [Bacteroidaceae bacterium]MDO4202099.1 dihydroorotase [Bacteroidales bacterium]